MCTFRQSHTEISHTFKKKNPPHCAVGYRRKNKCLYLFQPNLLIFDPTLGTMVDLVCLDNTIKWIKIILLSATFAVVWWEENSLMSSFNLSMDTAIHRTDIHNSYERKIEKIIVIFSKVPKDMGYSLLPSHTVLLIQDMYYTQKWNFAKNNYLSFGSIST